MTTKTMMRPKGISKTVYSLVFPETKEITEDLWNYKPHGLYEEAYTGWQDKHHKYFLSKWERWADSVVRFPSHLTHSYATHGSTEAIRETLALRAAIPKLTNRIHVFQGEYEGYKAFAEAYGLEVVTHDRETYHVSLEKWDGQEEVFYISQPSAIDGMVWERFSQFMDYTYKNLPQMQIMVDLTYVGSVASRYVVNLVWPHVHTVFFSLSKPFGVYYHRIGGVFSTEEIPTLYGNKWFKNMFSLELGMLLMKKYGVYDLPTKYKKTQIKATPSKKPLEYKPSDAILLAHKDLRTDGGFAWEKQLTRDGNNIARACLTPGMDQLIKENT